MDGLRALVSVWFLPCLVQCNGGKNVINMHLLYLERKGKKSSDKRAVDHSVSDQFSELVAACHLIAIRIWIHKLLE